MEILEINKIKILISGFCSTEEGSKGSVNLKIKQQSGQIGQSEEQGKKTKRKQK